MKKTNRRKSVSPITTPIVAENVIKGVALVIGIAIMMSFAYEVVVGVQPDPVQGVAMACLAIICVWLGRNA